MQVSKPQALLMQTTPTQIGQKAFLGVSVGVGFRLGDPRILCHEASVWAALSAVPQSVSLNELAMPKQFAEWLLLGHAVQVATPQRASNVVEWQCSAELGGVRKQLLCRQKLQPAGNAETPQTLRVLLDHCNAWRGEAQDNPCGTEPAAAQLLLQSAQGARPWPLAATAALDMRWAQRARLRPATYATPQEAASDGSHMGWPAHTDLRYFQQAAPDQWFNTAQWPTGASYVLRGLGPEGKGVAHGLPALCAYAAWQAQGEADYHAISLAQQSVWFLPDADIGVMWWHGQVGLDYPLQDRLAHLVAGLRGAGESFSLTALTAVARQRGNSKDRDVASESDQLLMPAACDGWTWEQIESADDHPNESPAPKSYSVLRKRVEARQKTLDDLERQHQEHKQRSGQLPKKPPAAALSMAAQPLLWQQKIAAMEHKVLRNVVLEGQDLRGMHWSGWTVEGVVFRHCDMGQSHMEDCQWKNVRMDQCALKGATLSRVKWVQGGMESCHADGMVWDSVDLQSLALVASDFTGTRMVQGHWDKLSLADLYGQQGVMQGIQLENCSVQDCNLAQWQWSHIKTSMLMLVRCQLPNLQVQRSRLERVSVVDVNLSHSRWQVCHLDIAVIEKKTVLADSHFVDCLFTKCCAEGVQASGMRADHCNLLEFHAPHLRAPRSQWRGCVLDNAQLSQANLHAAVFDACSLKGARLFGADLRLSQMRHSNLLGAQTSWALAAEPCHWHSNLTAGHIDSPRRSA